MTDAVRADTIAPSAAPAALASLAPLATSLGDDALILGQRLGEWCGHAPTLEIDMALANIALDLIGQAQFFLALAGKAEGDAGTRDADALAFHRDVYDFRNCLLVEQPNGDFGRTVARQFLFSNFQLLHFQALAEAEVPGIAEVAAKAVKEVAYHVRFATDWLVRLGDGTDESRARMRDGIDWCWRFTDELFAPVEGDPVDRAALRGAWDAAIDAALAEAGLDRPAPVRGIMGGRQGHHGEHLGHLLATMQFLPRAYPQAVW